MSVLPRTTLLVGDRFAGFAIHDEVFSISQFVEQLPLLAAVQGQDEPIVVQPGQGVTTAEWRAVRDQVARLGLEDRVELQFSGAPSVSPKEEVHKHRSQNALIADLRRESDGYFLADLRLHNDNELLLDHQTGQHVQGMVAVEAARQMFLAVSERFYASRYPDRSYYYVIDSMNTAFENFLFPLDATIEFVTVRAETADPERLSFTAEISVHQAGRRAALTTVSYTAFEPGLIESKETKRARHAVGHMVAAYRPVLAAA